MAEKLRGVMVGMGARTAAEAADDLEAIAAALRSEEGVAALPARLMFGSRALNVSVRTRSRKEPRKKVDGVEGARERASALLTRATEFCHGADTLEKGRGQGWLTSCILLLGYTAELIAKKRLLERGVDEDILKRQPYGHNIFDMWKNDVDLWAEAERIYHQFSLKGQLEDHLWVLDFFCGGESDYAIRYNSERTHYPEAVFLLPVFVEILRRERMRYQDWFMGQRMERGVLEQLKGVTIEMGARTVAEAADDLEAIAVALRSGEGVGALPSRLIFGPRALTVSVRTGS